MHLAAQQTAPHAAVMDAIEIVSANLKALMAHAADHGEGHIASQKGLARETGLGRPTIEGMLKGTRGAGVDTLEKVAQAFGLQALVLLVPGLDPSNTPVLSVSEAEKELYRTYEELKARFAPRTVNAKASQPGAVDVHLDSTVPTRRKKVAAGKSD